MAAKSLTAHEADHQAIPLDLEPLLSPYLHHERLSVRVEQLPPRARLSKGHNNGDGTFSLKPDDLDDLAYIPPDGADDPCAELAVRIVKLDDDYATTLELIDLKVPSEPRSKEPKKRTIRFSGTPERSKGETVIQLDTRQRKVSAENAAAPEVAPAGAHVETQKLQRAFDVLTQTLAETEARAADAEKQAEEAEALNAAHAARASEAEAAAENAQAEAAAAFEAELSQLRKQLDATATDADADELHKQALEAAATAHAREIEALQSAHARVLEDSVSAAKKELESAFEARLADTQREAGKSTEARLEAARKDWQANAEAELATAREQSKAEGAQEQIAATTEKLEQAFADRLADELRQVQQQSSEALTSTRNAWQAEEAERLAAAKKEFDIELAKLRQQLDDASVNFDEMRKQALDAAAAEHAKEITALQAAHAGALEEQTAATKEKLEQAFAERLAEAQRQAEEKAAAQLEEARQNWETEAEASLASVSETWQAEEAERAAMAKNEFDVEFARLRQQLDDASLNFDEMRKQALDAAAADHEQEVAALQSKHADALDAQSKEITQSLEQDFAKRLQDARSEWDSGSSSDRVAQAVRGAEEKAAAKLEEARQAWGSEAEANLVAAQETWKVEEAERLAAAFKVWQGQPQKSSEAKKAWRMPALPRFRVRLWLPPRSLAIKVAIVGALGLGLLHPEVKSRIPGVKNLVTERSDVAATELRVYFDPLISKVTGSEPLPEALPPRSTEASADSMERTTIGVGRANVRSGPTTGASVIETLDRGSALIVLGSQGSWLQVQFGEGTDEIGWVHSDLLGAAP